jgi:hypothetical protein
MSINLDAIKARLAEVHAAGVSGVTVRLADYGLRVTVQMRSWDGTTAHDGYEAVTHLLGNAPADIAALVEEVERLRAEVVAERAAVVVWLRDDAGFRMVPGNMAYCDYYADCIERGEHRREGDK